MYYVFVVRVKCPLQRRTLNSGPLVLKTRTQVNVEWSAMSQVLTVHHFNATFRPFDPTGSSSGVITPEEDPVGSKRCIEMMNC